MVKVLNEHEQFARHLGLVQKFAQKLQKARTHPDGPATTRRRRVSTSVDLFSADAIEVYANMLLSILRKAKETLRPEVMLSSVVFGVGSKLLLESGFDTRMSTLAQRTEKLTERLRERIERNTTRRVLQKAEEGKVSYAWAEIDAEMLPGCEELKVGEDFQTVLWFRKRFTAEELQNHYGVKVSALTPKTVVKLTSNGEQRFFRPIMDAHVQKQAGQILELGIKEDRLGKVVADDRVRRLVTATKSAFRASGNLRLWRGIHSVWLAFRYDPKHLSRLETELVYLQERLLKVVDTNVTDAAWQDYLDTWLSLLQLRATISSEVGQRVIESMVVDPKVIQGLGLAMTFTSVVGGASCAPGEVLQQLKDGPAHHIKQYAYKYRARVDVELINIRRVKDIQLRVVVAIGTTLASALFALMNLGIGYFYDVTL